MVDYCGSFPKKLQPWKNTNQIRRLRGVVLLVGGDMLYMVRLFQVSGQGDRQVRIFLPVLYTNIWEARNCWVNFGSILGRYGSDLRLSSMFYHAVFQSMLIYGWETWVINFTIILYSEGVNMGLYRGKVLIIL